MSATPNAADPFVNMTSDEAKQHLLFDIARRFKGVSLAVDAKIDAAAEIITGKPGIKMIPPVFAGEPRVPLYMEGEPGVGKTTLIRAAIKDFCQIAGLNFVENPPDDYKLTDNDFYYFTVNLSGKNNPSDVGGLPTKGDLEIQDGLKSRRKTNDVGDWLFGEIQSRARGMAGLAKLVMPEPTGYEKGSLRSLDVTLKGDSAQCDLVVNTLVRQLNEDAKKEGVGISVLKDGDDPIEGRLQIQVKKGTTGIRVTAHAPARGNEKVEYVAEMLPNRRFALATKTPFALVNFDDVANASESVRNVLLEVAQSNRYSGVMDIGNAMVTFTGNMGAEDNTNTQSEQSDAEVTRVFKIRIRDTPKDWAFRVAMKYNEPGDCMFSAFVHKYGNDDGVFRDSIGDGRSPRGVPKPNSRSLENALSKALPYFMMAKASNASPTIFADEIHTVVKGTAGANVADRYTAFMRSMLTDAIPLADQLMTTGNLDGARFEKNIGSETKSSEQDFAFRFAAAMADAFIDRVAFSEVAKKSQVSADDASFQSLIQESADRMCTGLSQMSPGTMNYSLSRLMTRMGAVKALGSYDGVEVKLSAATYDSMAKGFAASIARGVWENPDQAQKDFVSMVAGSNLSGAPKAGKKAARP